MKALKIIATLIVSIIVAFIFVEILSRSFRTYNDTNPVHIIPHPKLPYMMLKNSESTSILGNKIKINSHGFRDYEYNQKKPKDIYRIIVIGDSTTFGYGVELEDTYPKILEALLNSRTNHKKFEVLNMGVSGFNLIDYYNLFEEYGIKFQPDCIIVAIMRNDFTLNALDQIIINGIGMRPNSIWTRYRVPIFVLKILRNSGFYLTVGNAIKNINLKSNPPISYDELNESEKIKIMKSMYSYLSKFNKIAKDLNVPLYYLYLPIKREVNLNQHDDSQFSELLQNLSDSTKNIKYIDMLDEYRKYLGTIDEFYTKQDLVHPTPLGHSKYAERLFQEFVKLNKIQ